MIRIVITVQAYEAIVATLPIGSVGYQPEPNAKGERTTIEGGAPGRGTVFELVNRRRRLHAGHAAQLLRRKRGASVCRSDRRRRRGSLRHDIYRRPGGRQWHGVRNYR